MLGPIVALQQTAVPIAVTATPGPVLEGPAVALLQARLANVVDGLTQDALREAPTPIATPGAPARERRKTAAPDALDELIARARHPRRSARKPARKPRRP